MDTYPIAVIGMACHYPGAKDLRHFWENILTRKRQFRRIPDCRLPLADYFDPDPAAPDKTYCRQGALIDDFSFDLVGHRVPRSSFDSSDIVHWLALDVALKSIEDAGYTRNSVPTERSGVLLGNTLTGEHSRAEGLRLRWPFIARALKAAAEARGQSPAQIDALLKTTEEYYKSAFAPVTEDSLAGALSNTIAGRICNNLDFHGGGYTVDGACSSSVIAIATAATALNNGDMDFVLAGGVDISLDTLELIGFAKTGAITRSDMRVYDRRADGFIPGEGCGFVVLKRLEDAVYDGDYVYAILNGWGVSSDGKGGLTAPSAEGQARALRRAYDRAGYGVRDLDFIEGHGTGTSVGDLAELESIALAMDDYDVATMRKCGITSLKSIIGHTKAASGVGAFIKAVLAVNRRVIPPLANCDEPNPVFDDKASALYPVLFGTVRERDLKLKAGISGMGFGGINCHVTIESGDSPSAKLDPALPEPKLLASNQATELITFSGSTEAELTSTIWELQEMVLGMSEGELVDLAAHISTRYPQDRSVRIALVASSPEKLLENLAKAVELLGESPPARGQTLIDRTKGVFVGNDSRKHRVGFLFPGQGSQQLNMSRKLVQRHDWARKIVSAAEGHLGWPPTRKLSGFMFRETDRAADQTLIDRWQGLLQQSDIAQPSICLSSLLWLNKLGRLGIAPDAVGGHSLGELTAFHAAGAFNEEDLVAFAAFRGKAMAAPSGSDGAMASLACSLETSLSILNQTDGYAVAANMNSPKQTVISGELASIEQAIEVAKNRGITTYLLPVANAFHSRFVSGAAAQIRETDFIPAKLADLSTTLFSSMEGMKIAPGADLREHFSKQITSPVNFISLVKGMEDECDLILEVGPGRILTNLARATIGGDEPACYSVETEAGQDRDLNHFLAAYFVSGGTLKREALYEDRLVRPFTPAGEMVFLTNPCERPLAANTRATAPFASSVSGRLDSLLAEAAQISPAALSEYLEKRGDFLGAVIGADLESMGENSSRREPVPAIAAAPVPVADPAPDAPADDGDKGAPAEGLPAAELLLELVEKRTGFPRDSLSMELRLLDDLNLDSIKASELIVEAASALGVTADVDVAEYANAQLSEIAAVLDSFRPAAGAGGKGSDGEPAEPAHPTWVRDFAIEHTAEALPDTAAAALEDRWEGERVLVLSEPDEEFLALEIAQSFSTGGATTEMAIYENVRNEAAGFFDKFTTVIALLVRDPRDNTDGSAKWALDAIVERLHTVFTSAPRGVNGNGGNFVVVQFGGGRFGSGSKPASLEQCSAVALAASLHLERPELKVRVLDFEPGLTSDRLIDSLVAELSTEDSYGAAGYGADMVRRVPRPVVKRIADYVPRPASWTPEDVFLVTGGAKGITAECALELARVTGVRMALVGSSPPPEGGNGKMGEIVRTLGRFEEEDLPARYYQCDIVDGDAVKDLVRRVEADLGNITGVIHGSALNEPGELDSVSARQALAEIAPKLSGAANLCEALQGTPPKLFIAFSSIIGVSGMMRNGWYGFSNEALNLVLQRFEAANPQTSVLSIAFSIWDEVGMGVRMGSTKYLARIGIDAIPVDEGAARFVRLVTHDPGEKQVVVAARTAGLDTFNPRPAPAPEGLRFLEEIIAHHPGIELVARARLTLERDAYIRDHQWRGTYLFPMVFGLEAMAQAVRAVTGTDKFDSLRIEDIELERPITIAEGAATAIEIRAEVREAAPGDPGQRVHVQVRTEHTGFSKDHFSATFVLNPEQDRPREEVPGGLAPLDIVADRDLYRKDYLFQGPLFRRLDTIHQLDSSGCIFRTAQQAPATSVDAVKQWHTGDPFLRDSLLQSVQVSLPRDLCLPLRIASIERFPVDSSGEGSLWGKTRIEERNGDDVHSSVTVFDDSGQVVERLRGYVARIIERREDRPAAEEIADPGQRDCEIIDAELSKRCRLFNLAFPEVDAQFIPDLKRLSREQRRDRELPLLNSTAYRALGEPENGSRVSWTNAGKPYIEGQPENEIGISLTHNLGTVICTAGQGPQGCDLEVVSSRDEEEWIALIGKQNRQLLDRLVDGGDSLDAAGTRIWTAAEAAWKAFSGARPELAIEERDGENVLFRCIEEGDCRVLTFPVNLTLGSERFVAIVTRGNGHKEPDRSVDEARNARACREAGDCFNSDGELTHEFKTTFIEGRTPGGRVSFTNIPVWMGRLRELSLEPVAGKMVKDMRSGKWGMVTNASSLSVERFAGSLDNIVGTIRLLDETNLDDSFISIGFDWSKKTEDGRELLIATSKLSTTWVSIEGHGIVKRAPLPGYFTRFLESIPATDSSHWRGDDVEAGPVLKPVFTAEIADRKGILLERQAFTTSMEDSNLVGNIYYSNYYSWQARLLDSFLYRQLPGMFQQNNDGEFACSSAGINHLQEAMPFDTIEVSMYLHDLYEDGLKAYFEYHSVNGKQEKRKLAHGTHAAIWTAPGVDDEEISPMKMPAALFDYLQGLAGEDRKREDASLDASKAYKD